MPTQNNISCHHFLISERPSTRLHAPPGGVSSISFGDDTPSNTKQPAAAARATNNIFGEQEDPKPSTSGVRRTPAQSAAIENNQPAAGGRVKQQPGGNSSLVLG